MAVSIAVLAAGQGTRMHSHTPKVLHEIAGRPMALYVLDAVERLGPAATALVIGHEADLVRRTLGDGGWTYVMQSQQLGTGHALLQCREALAQRSATVLLLYADVPLITLDTLSRVLDHHRATKATVTALSFFPEDPQGYGRMLRDTGGRFMGIVEERVANAEQRAIRESNSGIYCFDDAWVWNALAELPVSAAGEYFVTDLIAAAVDQGRRVEALSTSRPEEVAGINDRVQLAEVERVVRRQINERLMLAGVTMIDPATVYCDAGVEIGADTVILPNSYLRGRTRIGRGCIVGPNSVLTDTRVGDDCKLEAVFAEGAELENKVSVGPYAHLRAGAHLAEGVHMGNFGEVKKSYLGAGTKMGHFSYIGDAEIGSDVNIGAGTITCNFDGTRKNKTIIGNDVFIGSDTMLVAPVEIGPGAKTGAGSVVTHDVPANSLAYGVPARVRGRPETDGSE